MEKLFVYGTLLDERIQKEVTGKTFTGVETEIEDWAISPVTVEGIEYKGLVPEVGANPIKGKLLEGLSEEDLSVIDEWETSAYRRILLPIGWVYVIRN